MTYVRNTWIDDDGSDTVGTTVSAALMNNIEQGVADAQPMIGEVRMWARRAIPAGWQAALGARFTQAAYPDAYVIAGSENAAAVAAAETPLWTQRTSDTTFTVPDLTDSFVLAPGARKTGTRGGTPDVALAVTELPDHVHPGRLKVDGGVVSGNVQGGTGTTFGFSNDGAHGVGAGSNGLTGSVKNTNGSAPAALGAAHTNMPPFVVVGFIVRLA